MQPPTLTLVVNPTAGRGRAARALPGVVQELLTGVPSARVQVVRATSYEEARIRCIAAVEGARSTVVDGRRDCLVVMGGDGMMHLGLNAAATSGVPLGLVPAGDDLVAQRRTEAPRATSQTLPHREAPLVQGRSFDDRPGTCVRLVGEQRDGPCEGVHAQLAVLVGRPDLAGARLMLLDQVELAALDTAARQERAQALDADDAARAEADDDERGCTRGGWRTHLKFLSVSVGGLVPVSECVRPD